MALAHAALSHPDQVLTTADELGLGQRLDLRTIDGRGIELPVEVGQGLALARSRPRECGGPCSARGDRWPAR